MADRATGYSRDCKLDVLGHGEPSTCAPLACPHLGPNHVSAHTCRLLRKRMRRERERYTGISRCRRSMSEHILQPRCRRRHLSACVRTARRRLQPQCHASLAQQRRQRRHRARRHSKGALAAHAGCTSAGRMDSPTQLCLETIRTCTRLH